MVTETGHLSDASGHVLRYTVKARFAKELRAVTDRRDDAYPFPFRSSSRLADLERELHEVRLALKTLTRQLQKAEARHAETEQAYTKTVANLVQTTQENLALRHECERLRQRVPRNEPQMSRPAVAFGLSLSPVEIAAIRKAMARLHHPDAGGDTERMQAWNVALDALED